MTMNLTPRYNQSPRYLQLPAQQGNQIPMRINVNETHQNQAFRMGMQQRTPQTFNQGAYISNIPQYSSNRGNSITNMQHNMSQRYVPGAIGYVSRQNLRGKYTNGVLNMPEQEVGPRQINQMRPQQQFNPYFQANNYQSPVHLPMHLPVHSTGQYNQQNNQFQEVYRQPRNLSQGQIYKQPQYLRQPQQQSQNYLPLYTSTMMNNYQSLNNLMHNQSRRDVPQKSINSNFSYENANFDCNYQVQENLLHCVICNQTYKTNQKKQHVQLHRQKAKNVKILPVNEQQLKRLQKYNSMSKKGLMFKPIVQPDEFNVQYNPNQFVLKKVTQYRDIDHPYTNDIQIQTQNLKAVNAAHNLASNFVPQNRQVSNQMSRNSQNRPQSRQVSNQMSRNSQNRPQSRQVSNQMSRNSQNRQGSPSMPRNQAPFERIVPQRNTNTRFNNQSVRQEQEIFLSGRFQNNQPTSGLKANLDLKGLSEHRQTQRRSNNQSLSLSQRYKYTQSVYRNTNLGSQAGIQAGNLGYQKKDTLHNINQTDQYKNNRKSDSQIHI